MNLTVLKAGFFKPLQRKGIKMIDAAFVALNENLLDFIRRLLDFYRAKIAESGHNMKKGNLNIGIAGCHETEMVNGPQGALGSVDSDHDSCRGDLAVNDPYRNDPGVLQKV